MAEQEDIGFMRMLVAERKVRRGAALLLLLGLVFVALRIAHGAQPRPVVPTIPDRPVVVVGVTARYAPTEEDRAVLATHPTDAQVGAISIRPRYIGDCAAAGWATLGAGRRTSVGGLCDPRVDQQQVLSWPQVQAAAAGAHGDARLGTLATSVPGCVAAVGPGAALAAARPDGTLAHYDTLSQFRAEKFSTPCHLTLVDAGQDSDPVIAVLAARPDITLIVAGIGPAAGSHDPGLQLIYALPATPAGWLTSASTRRDGVVNLTDLTRTLIDLGSGDLPTPATIDGQPLQVRADRVTADGAQRHLAAIAALSDAVRRADLAVGIGGAVLVTILVICLLTRRFAIARVITALGCTLPAVMMATGAFQWNQTGSPALILSILVVGWSIVMTVTALALARRFDLPVAITGAALVVTAFTIDAALGGMMQPGSMLNSRPVNGGRWYGFGNVTFAAYAAAALVLAGYLADRLRAVGRRRSALAVVAVIGFGVVICEGWPSMGADFGGVVAFTPAVLWLLLITSGLAVTWRKLVGAGAVAVSLVGVISWLDWRRGPTSRSHLGNFVQRLIDGDAQDIIIRKAAAAAESLMTLLGIGSVALGILAWILIFHRLVPSLKRDFGTIGPVAAAALGVAILGTVLNDGGISVWLTLTASFILTVATLLIDRTHHDRLDQVPGQANAQTTPARSAGQPRTAAANASARSVRSQVRSGSSRPK